MPVPWAIDWCVWSARRPPTHPCMAPRRARDAATWMLARLRKNNPGVTAPYCSVHRSCADESIWQAIQLFAAVCSNRKLIAENSKSVCSWT